MNNNDIQLINFGHGMATLSDLNEQLLVHPQQPNEELYDPMSQSQVHLEVGQALLGARNITKSFMVITLFKILILLVIMTKGFDCYMPQQIWLTLMLAYDIVYMTHSFSIIYYLPKTPMRFLLVNYDPTDPEYQDTNLSGFIIGQCISHYYQPINGVTTISSCEHYFRCIGSLAEVLRVLYILLFIFGNIFLYIGLATFEGFDNIVFLTYLTFGYLYLLIPLILCISWPCLVIGIFCFQLRQPNQPIVEGRKPLQQKLFKKYLIPQKYKNVVPEENQFKDQCTICFVEYEPCQSIIQLPCNANHYFHKECCEKWLSINGTCPICRGNIEKKINQQKNSA